MLLQRDGNRGPAAAPQNIYQSAETDEFGRADSWVAIAVSTDAQWAALRVAIGQPEWAMDPALESADGRKVQHDLIDEELAAWCLPRTGDEIVETLWPLGVPVAKVMQPHRQLELPQLRFRRFFEHVGHPVNNPA
ncbi:CoA transferase, partial [Streptomyces sp. DSM 41634]|uniref:CoA transferase n=1 Tax=Streptomyces sp. DSM 41634 TaxID=3448656 RepID=UPI00403FEBDB